MEGLDRGETQASGHHWADLEKKKKVNLLSPFQKREKDYSGKKFTAVTGQFSVQAFSASVAMKTK